MKDASQSRRLLSLAAVLDGKSRAEAATIGGMDRAFDSYRRFVNMYSRRCATGFIASTPLGRMG